MIIGCSHGSHLAKKIAKKLKRPYSQLEVRHFPDSEMYLRFKVDVKGKVVVLVQCFYGNINDCVIETLFAAETAADLGATDWKVFRKVTFPIISVGVLGAGLFGFTLSYDEFARTLMVVGMKNTLPLEIFARMSVTVRPVVYALGSLSTLISFVVIGIFLYASKKWSERVLAKQKL